MRVLKSAIAMMLAAAPALGQSKAGTTIGQFLLIEPSARIAAMGNAGASLLEGLDAAYYNPAALSAAERLTVQVTHSSWLAGIAYDHAALAVPLGRWGCGFAAVTALNSGEMDVRTVAQPLGTGERFTVSDLTIGLGYARRITDRFSGGARVNYVQETIWHSPVNTVTFSFGTLFELSDNGLRIGSSLTNLGTQGSFQGRDLRILYDNDPTRFGDNGALPGERFTDEFPVPVLFRVGLGMPYRIPRVGRFQFAVDAFHPNDNTESMSMGAEFEYHDQIAVRCGWQNLFLQDSEVGLTAGAGVKGTVQEREFNCDYAWTDQGRLGGTHRFTLGLTF
jgi:hypothetical protein